MHRSALLASAAILFVSPALAQSKSQTVETVTVTAQKLDEARSGIQAQTGASTYTVTAADISNQPGGDNLQLNSVILQAPGVAQDSFGQLHVRGEHNGLQYRLNGIILPEGIAVFGQTLDPRLAESVKLIDGALPAEYGNQTGGIIDMQTKSGLFAPGGHIGLYGGSHSTMTPSFDYGGSSGSLNYFVSGDYTSDVLGIESPDGRANPDHDRTYQYHGFGFVQDILDQNSSLTGIAGVSNNIFQIPNRTGLQPSGMDGIIGMGPLSAASGDYVLSANGVTSFPSEQLNERQREITDYAIASYLRTDGDLDSQISFFGRYSSLAFTPGQVGTPGTAVGDLLYDGISQTAYKRDEAYGVQAESAWHLGEHTLHFGFLGQMDQLVSRTTSLVLATGAGGPLAPGVANPNPNPLCTDPSQTCQISIVPNTVLDNANNHAWSYGVYAQDEWKITSNLTLNYGLRYDQYKAFNAENQLSPRANLVWDMDGATAFHIGYARYFSPPPYENVASNDVALFANTTAAPANTDDATPKAERADYYDAGMTRKIGDTVSLGLDSYFKADSNLLDEGQFGAPIILTPFNYQTGRQYGAEFTANYNAGDFNAYLNASYERAAGRTITTSQFEFDPGDLAYIQNNYIPLDHQQVISVSGGASYNWDGTILSSDFIYGSGLRRDGATPNGSTVPDYVTVNLGISHSFDIASGLTLRADVLNLTDTRYEIRDGTGVGVGAPQYGARRGVFFGVSKAL